MANHYVRETKAAREISAFVILSPTGDEVATVNLHHTQSRTIANVWQSDDAAKRSAEFAEKNRSAEPVKHPDEVAAFPFQPTVKAPKGRAYAAEDFRFQVSRAGGYGYDKRTAALAGMIIDGIPLTDHCSRFGAPIGPDHGRFPQGYEAPKGFRLSNWFRIDRTDPDRPGRFDRSPLPDGWTGYADCYREPGLGVLEALGYRVIQAI